MDLTEIIQSFVYDQSNFCEGHTGNGIKCKQNLGTDITTPNQGIRLALITQSSREHSLIENVYL